MGILNSGFGLIPDTKIKRPEYVGGDFPDGLIITEYVNGARYEATQIVLRGTFAPKQPFTFGGEQKLVKENYSGSRVASAQVLMPVEDDITINGTLKSKFLKPTANVSAEDMRLAAEAYQQNIDAMRKRGNLVQIQLGEFTRYGLIQKATFDLRTRADIDYSITFAILSESFPSESRFTDRPNDDLTGPNAELAAAALEQLDAARNYPEGMPLTISDVLDSAISDVASAIAVVTDFVDGILDDAEKIQASVNRAVGLIRYARSKIAVSARRVGAIATTAASLGSSFATAAEQAAATVKNIDHLNKTQRSFGDLASMLAALQAKFAGLKASIPLRRHLVQEGDTLQKLAIRYYNNADQWKKIYDHNRLSTTELVVGQVLEIPRL